MNPRTTGILFLITLALGAFVYFYEIAGEDARREAEEQAKRLFPGVEQEAIESVAVTTSDGEQARIEKRQGDWVLVTPLEFPADRYAADGMAASLATLASAEELEDPEPPAEYGLDEETARVVRFTADGEEHVLRLGRDTPVGSNAYAAIGGGEAIYTVSGSTARTFQKSLDDLREKRILDFDSASIRRVEVSWPDGGVVLERSGPEENGDASDDADGEGAPEAPAIPAWRMLAPVEARADADAVEDLLSDLAFLRANGFLDAPTDPAASGFEPPAFDVVLHGGVSEGEEAPRFAIAIGGQREGNRLVRAGQPSLYTIPAQRLEDLPRQVFAYRYKQLARFPASDAEQVELFFQAGAGDPVSVTATRSEEGWVAGPEPLDPGKVPSMISELSRLEAAGILAESPDEAELRALELSPPNTIVTVLGAPPEGSEAGDEALAPKLAEIHLGAFEGGQGIAARAAGDSRVYRLDLSIGEFLPVNLDALRNRFLAEEDAPEDEGLFPGAEGGDFLSPQEESP